MSAFKIKHKDNQLIIISKLDKTEEINQQEVNVMQSKIIRGLMKPTAEKSNRIVYTAPNGITLKEYLRNDITVNDFFVVFAQILEAVKSVDRNSFNMNNLVLNLNYSFINTRTKELHFIYQPIRSMAVTSNFASFLYDVAYSVNLGLAEDYSRINMLINFLKEQQTISVQKIEEYILNVYPQVYKQVKRQKPGQSQMLQGGDLYYRRNDFEKKEKEYQPEIEKDIDDGDGTNILFEDEDIDTDTMLLDEFEDGPTVLLIDDEEDTDGTALLFQETKNYPYLIRTSNYDRIEINKPVFRIGKERSYVDYFVQNNSAVSRLHADIITKSNQYYVKDNHSTNHTFVNGVGIPAEQEVEIFDGDSIKLANEMFDFHID